jgi:hypothetical protein
LASSFIRLHRSALAAKDAIVGFREECAAEDAETQWQAMLRDRAGDGSGQSPAVAAGQDRMRSQIDVREGRLRVAPGYSRVATKRRLAAHARIGSAKRAFRGVVQRPSIAGAQASPLATLPESSLDRSPFRSFSYRHRLA